MCGFLFLFTLGSKLFDLFAIFQNERIKVFGFPSDKSGIKFHAG